MDYRRGTFTTTGEVRRRTAPATRSRFRSKDEGGGVESLRWSQNHFARWELEAPTASFSLLSVGTMLLAAASAAYSTPPLDT